MDIRDYIIEKSFIINITQLQIIFNHYLQNIRFDYKMNQVI